MALQCPAAGDGGEHGKAGPLHDFLSLFSVLGTLSLLLPRDPTQQVLLEEK